MEFGSCLGLMLKENFYGNLLFENLSTENVKKVQKSRILIIGDLQTVKANIANFVELKIGHVGVFSDNTKSVKTFFEKGDYDTNLCVYNSLDTELSDVIGDYDIIVDCLRSFEDKFKLNELAIKKQKPFVFSFVSTEQGQVALIWPNKTACLECMFPKTTKMAMFDTNPDYISNAISALQSDITIRAILNIQDEIDGCLLTYDVINMQCNKILLTRKSDCKACNK